MDFKKFIQDNKVAISKLAIRNSNYDTQGNALITKEEMEEDTYFDKMYDELNKNKIIEITKRLY